MSWKPKARVRVARVVGHHPPDGAGMTNAMIA